MQSDIYALGLVLYELFTGRSAFEASSLGELIDTASEGGAASAPSAWVESIDPAVERVHPPVPGEGPEGATGFGAGGGRGAGDGARGLPRAPGSPPCC